MSRYPFRGHPTSLTPVTIGLAFTAAGINFEPAIGTFGVASWQSPGRGASVVEEPPAG